MSKQHQRLHVGLVGAGIGGLAAAIAIARAGARVTVLEAASELGEIGAGIQMTPNVSRFLIKWGVSDIIGPDLVQCDEINMRRTDGKIIAYTDFKKVVREYGYPWWVVHRHHLHTGLAEGARRHGCNLVVGARVTKIDDSSSPVKVTTEKGVTYEFDLLIGSDGLKSVVRTVLFPDVKPRAPTKNAAYRGVIPYDEVFAKVPEAKSLFRNSIDVWGSPGGYIISYPISAGKDLNLVLSHHRDNYVEEVEDPVDMNEFRNFYKDYDPLIKKIIGMVPSSKRWPLLVTGPLKSWSNEKKNVVLMGDAAHSMVNHMAQGAATSMEDGAFLGRIIAEVVRGSITIPEGIEIYEKTRMPRVWTKQQVSFVNGSVYMAEHAQANIRDKASTAEVQSSTRNMTTMDTPPPAYRSWNLWGYPDSIPGVYTYDAEGDADYAVCRFLQDKGEVDPNTKVAKHLEKMWSKWSEIEAKAVAKL